MKHLKEAVRKIKRSPVTREMVREVGRVLTEVAIAEIQRLKGLKGRSVSEKAADDARIAELRKGGS